MFLCALLRYSNSELPIVRPIHFLMVTFIGVPERQSKETLGKK